MLALFQYMNALAACIYQNITGWYSLSCASVPQSLARNNTLSLLYTALVIFSRYWTPYSSVH